MSGAFISTGNERVRRLPSSICAGSGCLAPSGRARTRTRDTQRRRIRCWALASSVVEDRSSVTTAREHSPRAGLSATMVVAQRRLAKRGGRWRGGGGGNEWSGGARIRSGERGEYVQNVRTRKIQAACLCLYPRRCVLTLLPLNNNMQSTENNRVVTSTTATRTKVYPSAHSTR